MDTLDMIQPAETETKRDTHFLFDFGFGVIAPVLCLIFDPGLFNAGWLLPYGLLGFAKVFVYVAAGLGVTTLAFWLLFRPYLQTLTGLFTGIFLMGLFVLSALDLLLIPLIFLSLTVSISALLGCIPFLTTFVFYRQWRVARTDAPVLPNHRRSAFIGAMTVIAIPIILQTVTFNYVHTAIRDILNDPSASSAAVSRLKSAFWCGDECFYDLTTEYYEAKKDAERQQYLASVYRDITGIDIKSKMFGFSD